MVIIVSSVEVVEGEVDLLAVHGLYVEGAGGDETADEVDGVLVEVQTSDVLASLHHCEYDWFCINLNEK